MLKKFNNNPHQDAREVHGANQGEEVTLETKATTSKITLHTHRSPMNRDLISGRDYSNYSLSITIFRTLKKYVYNIINY